MLNPAIRSEWQEALAQLRQQFNAAIAPLTNRFELKLWGEALLARIEASECRAADRHASSIRNERFELDMQRLHAEFARKTKETCESIATRTWAGDDRYADLCWRVSRLEAEVFGRRWAQTGGATAATSANTSSPKVSVQNEP